MYLVKGKGPYVTGDETRDQTARGRGPTRLGVGSRSGSVSEETESDVAPKVSDRDRSLHVTEKGPPYSRYNWVLLEKRTFDRAPGDRHTTLDSFLRKDPYPTFLWCSTGTKRTRQI